MITVIQACVYNPNGVVLPILTKFNRIFCISAHSGAFGHRLDEELLRPGVGAANNENTSDKPQNHPDRVIGLSTLFPTIGAQGSTDANILLRGRVLAL